MTLMDRLDPEVALAIGALPFTDMNAEQEDPLFLRQARSAGHVTVSGLSMLAHGGAACFHAWTGQQAPVEVLRAELLRATAAPGADQGRG